MSLLPEILIFEPAVYVDERGWFLELFRENTYKAYCIPPRFVQDNISFSKRGVLRGLHYQIVKPQGKLVTVLSGEILDAAVDVRRGSPTFGKAVTVILSSDNHQQVYIPEGFAHGFCVTSDSAHVHYRCTDYYDPLFEKGILWNDPDLHIPWHLCDPVLSPKDGSFPLLRDILPDDLPVYEPDIPADQTGSP